MYFFNNLKGFFKMNKVFYVFVVLSLLAVVINCSPVEPDRSLSNINEVAKMFASDGVPNAFFGWRVAIDGDTAIVSGSRRNTNGSTAGAAYIFTGSGATWTEQAKLIADDDSAATYTVEGYYGWSVAIDGDTAIVGSFFDNDNGIESGSAYIFIRSGVNWTQQAKIIGNDIDATDYFGYSVAINGNYAIVGAINRDLDIGVGYTGAAYIFIRNGTNWTQQAKIKDKDAERGDRFGHSVAIEGDYAVVGSSVDIVNGIKSGSAYVFIRNDTTWTEQAKLTATDLDRSDQFGQSVAISGNTVIVGANRESDNDNRLYDNGAAYVFTRNGTNWTQQAKIVATDRASEDRFGYSVAISGDTVIVGANREDGDKRRDNTGSAYLFTRSGGNWIEQAKFIASDGLRNDYFGSVALDGNTVVIGSVFDDDNGEDSGSAYIFQMP